MILFWLAMGDSSNRRVEVAGVNKAFHVAVEEHDSESGPKGR